MTLPAIEHRAFRRAHLRGELAPGTYLVVNPALDRREVATLPTRTLPWIQAPNGRLWHRVRLAKLNWYRFGKRRRNPGANFETWCGMSINRGIWQGREPRMAASPHGATCRFCDCRQRDDA